MYRNQKSDGSEDSKANNNTKNHLNTSVNNNNERKSNTNSVGFRNHKSAQ